MYSEYFRIIPEGTRVIKLTKIPRYGITDFMSVSREAITDIKCDNVPVAYFLSGQKLFMILFDYKSGSFLISSTIVKNTDFDSFQLDSLFQFERDIYERSDIFINNHPYLKPLRRPAESKRKFEFSKDVHISLHEVNVGPVHAGIIEPGQFRFICNGEIVTSLEVSLGYQRRGIEKLIIESPSNIKRMLLAEQISGDSVIANSIAMANILESGLEKLSPDSLVYQERAFALEMERLAMHFADLAALSGDCAYYIGQTAIEPLRTIIINSLQLWSGSRSGRSLVRPGGSFYRLSLKEIDTISKNIDKVRKLFKDIASNLLSSPSLLSRLDGKCPLSQRAVKDFAVRGTIAKASNLPRDIRTSLYSQFPLSDFTPAHCSKGDLLSRLRIRIMEVQQSFELVFTFLNSIKAQWHEKSSYPNYQLEMPSSSLIISPVEGFRGTIFHVAITDPDGEITDYRIFDPSMLSWPVLAYAMKNQQISDFPVCNKSFNLSYLANDL